MRSGFLDTLHRYPKTGEGEEYWRILAGTWENRQGKPYKIPIILLLERFEPNT